MINHWNLVTPANILQNILRKNTAAGPESLFPQAFQMISANSKFLATIFNLDK
jgi:hypothetical protein